MWNISSWSVWTHPSTKDTSEYTLEAFQTYFLIFSNTSAILPKRFWKKTHELYDPGMFLLVSRLKSLCATWAFCATSSTSWNFSDTVKSSFGGSWIKKKWNGSQQSCTSVSHDGHWVGSWLTMGSETSGTMLHWILQPLQKYGCMNAWTCKKKPRLQCLNHDWAPAVTACSYHSIILIFYLRKWLGLKILHILVILLKKKKKKAEKVFQKFI